MNASHVPTILQVIPTLETGGAERTAVDIAAAVTTRGWTAVVASAGGRLVAELEKGGCMHVSLPLDSKNPVTIWRNAKRLTNVIREHGIDLIHARSRAPAWSALIAARRCNIPFVTTYHGAYNQTNALKALYNSVMARSDRVIANSIWTAKLIEDRHPWAAQRITAIPRGTDFSCFDPETTIEDKKKTRHSWGLNDDHFIFLHLARLTGWKGQSVVIDAATRVVEAYPDARFVLAGDAQGRQDYRNGLIAQIKALGLDDQVSLPGHCDRPEAALAAADTVVVASTQAEAFGRAAVEAGALEKPVIVTDIGAVGETVVSLHDADAENITGWKVPPNDHHAMARAMLEVIAMSAASRLEIGKRARRHGRERFSLEAMCEATMAVYDDLLQR